MNNVEHLKNISLDGGMLCFDFINTVSDYMVDEPVNYITNEQEWLTWLQRVKLAGNDLAGLEGDSGESEKDSGGFEKDSFNIREILEVRETLYKLFGHYVRGEEIPDRVLTKFNRHCTWMNRHLKFVREGKGIVEMLDYNRRLANDYLLPVIRSAKEVLASRQLKNVKECPNCGWIFLDNTKSNTRRWCNMKACGNKIKTQKYYRKVSGKGDDGSGDRQ